MSQDAISLENSSLFVDYPSSSSCEAFSSPGVAREHWQPLISALDRLGREEITHRLHQAQQKFEDHGVTYNLFSDSGELERPWELDLLPFIIAPSEWRQIEQGCIQRAHLLNTILADLYGSQSLIKQGMLPAELVFGNPGFLYPCHGMMPPENHFLPFYALDIYRDSQGGWKVLGDYGRNPKGLGFSLENRIVLSQVLPRIFHNNQVERVAPFFQNLRDELAASASRHRDDPRIAILSAGPKSENYFEHAFLARYLTLTLVESGDLTVRDNRLFLKTLRTLEPVDVIFRCLADTNCDPLIFSGKDSLGVPGLFHAVRSGNVSISNALGACLVDTPSLLPFLPGLSRHLLNEDLLLPSSPMWWCGQNDGLRYVREHFDNLCVVPAFRKRRGAPIITGSALDRSTKDQLLSQIEESPYKYSAFEPFSTATSPSWSENGVVPKHAILRLFVTASNGSYTVLPGGLCRISSDMNALLAESRQATGSKDIWVLSDQPVASATLLSNLHRIGDIHRRSDLPSRVADNLLWLGRYLERLEGALRLFRSVVWRLDDETETLENWELQILIEMLENQHLLDFSPDRERGGNDVADFGQAVRDAVFSTQETSSIKSLIQLIHRTAASVRDRLSWDAWRVLSRLEQTCKAGRNMEHIGWVDVEQCLNEQITSLSAFSGLFMESTTRGQGWRFMDMGRRLERASFIVVLARKSLIRPADEEERALECLLEVLDSSMTYRARYRTSIQVAPALDLLLLDESNPRSLAFQLMTLASHVEHLPRENTRPFSTSEEQITLQMLTATRLADLEHLHSIGEEGVREALDIFLGEMKKGLESFAQIITQNYLSRIPTTQHFNTIFPETRR